MKRILFITTRNPFSGRYSGDVIRAKKFVKHLSKKYQMSVVSLSQKNQEISGKNFIFHGYKSDNIILRIVYIFFENRNLLGFSLFATTGWSTVIYYLSLFLSKNNIISKNRALHINFISNTFFRCPLIIFNAAYLLQYLFINKTVITDLETVCTFLLFSILIWNGLYFQYQVSFKYFQTIQI